MINHHQAYEMALEYLDGMDVFASRQPFVSEDKEAFNIKQFNQIEHRLEAVRFIHPHGKNLNQYPVNSGSWFEYEEQYKIVNIYGELDDE